jgi:hypothetical protein
VRLREWKASSSKAQQAAQEDTATTTTSTTAGKELVAALEEISTLKQAAGVATRELDALRTTHEVELGDK